MNNKSQENPTFSNQLKKILPKLSRLQLKYLAILPECANKDEAAQKIGIAPNTIYGWPRIVKQAEKLITLEMAETAREIRKQALLKAILVKIAGLESEDERIRQAAATEIIEGELGKAALPLNVNALKGYVGISPDDWDKSGDEK